MRTMTTSIWSLAFLVTVFLVLACDVTRAVSTTPPPAPTGDATQEVTKVPTDTVTADPTSPPTLTAWTSPPSATGFSTAPSDPSQNPTDTSTSLTSGAVTSPVTSPPQTKASTDAPFTSPVTVSPNASTRAPTTKAPPATPPPCIISASALASLVQPTYTFDATAAVRVVPALTRALTCNLPSNVYWRVAARAVVTAPYLVLSAGVLSLGTYRCSVSFIIPATQVNVTVPFTITVFEPVPVVKISGGNQTIKYNTPLSIVVAIKSGTIKTWAWSCCAVASNFCFATSCSMLMSYADGFVVGRLLTVLSANSEYRVTVTAKTQGGQTCNDSIAVDVLSSAVNTVSLTASPTGPVYLNDTLFLIARPKLRFSVFNWSVTSGDAVVTPIAKWGNAVAMVRPRSIGTLVVSVTATDPNHVQGTSAINMAVRALPTGTCAVTSTDSIIVGGSSPVTITLTQWSGTSDAKFRFGYVRRTGNRVTLSPDYGLNRNMTVTAPLLVPAGAVAFYVESSEGNVAVWCTAFVASMSDLSGLIADRTTDMQSSLSSDDVGALMRSVMDLMSALKASNVSDAAVFAAGNQILAGISTVLRADPAYLTTTLKGQAVDALTEYYDFVNRTARGADVTLQTNIVYALAAVFSTTNSSQDVDVSSHATALALIVDQLNATTLALTQTARQAKKILAQQLALCVAAQLDLGDTINVTSDTLTISAARLPASQIGGFDGSGATFNSTGGTASIRVPLGALAIGLNTSIDDDALLDAEISVSATVHGMNPVPTAAVAAGKTLSGAIVEFDVAASGGDFSAGLTVEITVGLRSSPNATCVFFDSTLNAWSTSGVTTIGYDDFTGQLLCNTSHLSLFTGTVDSLAPTTTIRPIPTATPTTTTTTVATSPTSSADPTSDTQSTSSPNSGGTTPPATTTPAPWHMSTTTASPAIGEQTGVPSTSSDDGPLGPLSTVSIAIIVTVVIILVIVGVISVIIIVKLRRPVKKSSEAALSKRAKDYGVKDDVPVSIEAHQPSPSPPPPPAVPASATPTSQPPLGQSSIALSGREALKETKAFPDGV